jgi:hypothetical protein
MVDPRTIELIHAAIDGELDAGARAELEQRLQADPDAAALHADLVKVSAMLAGMAPVPVDAALHDRIVAGLPPESVGPTNLSGLGPYSSHAPAANDLISNDTLSGIGTGVPIAPKRDALATSPHHGQGRIVMKNSKKLALVGLAASIGAVVYFGLGYPPSRSDVAGTIVPAERYQADTVGASDVVLGDETTAKFIQSDTFRMIQGDHKLAAFMSSDGFRAAMANDGFRAALANDGFRAALANDGFRAALANDGFRAALANDGFRAALANDSFRAALANDGFRAALANDRFRAALANDSFRAAMANDGFRAAMANDGFRAALANDSFRAALANDSFRAALANDSFRAAMANDSFRAALANDGFRAAMANDSFRAAMASDSFRAALANDATDKHASD